jgi:molybdenum cofactor cytidylyltransferase
MIAGIVLAAGRSRRMGEPKAFLRLEGRSFLERTLAALHHGGCAELVVVTGPREDDVARRIAESALALGARVVVNPAPDSEQADSLRLGLRVLPDDAEAAVVAPVDVPEVEAALVLALVEAFRRTGAPIALPSNGGRHGHPVLFARGVWPELLEGPLPEGARTVIRAHAADLVEVPVPRLAADVDTPEDFRRLAEGVR